MMWKTKTHQFTATVCQRTGRTCPALAQMARAVVQAMETAIPATTPQFELEGNSELTHCTQGCFARFRAQADQIRVFCGTDADTPIETLDDYADMMFGLEFTTRPANLLPTPPCAMLEVSTLAQNPVAQPERHVAL